MTNNPITEDDIENYTPSLSLTQHVGLITAYSDREVKFRGSLQDLWHETLKMNGKNFLFGWWSLSSLITNPLYIVGNFLSYNRYKKQVEAFNVNPEQFIMAMRDEAEEIQRIQGERDQNRKDSHTGRTIFLATMAVLAILVVLALIEQLIK